MRLSHAELRQHALELYEAKHLEEAVRVLSAILAEDNRNVESYQARGQCYLELHNYSKAISDLRRATELHENATTDHQRAVAHYYAHLYASLESESPCTAKASYPGSEGLSTQGWRHYNRALSAYYLSQYTRAIEDFSLVLSEMPNFAAGFRCRGTAYLHLGDFSNAIADLLESSRLERSATTFYNLGLAFGNMQQFASAVKYFTQAISLNANDAATYSNRGISYKSLQQYEAAIADFSTSLNLNPSSASAYDHRGQCHYELANYTAACEDFARALDLHPTAPRFARRAAAKSQLGDTSAAVADLDAAIHAAPSSPDLTQYFVTRARYLLKTDPTQAEIDFGRAITHSPANIDAIYSRAAVRRVIKDYTGAETDLKLAQRLDGTEQLRETASILLSPFCI
jgi:tetratricopeptide (TPR) repeat protein